MFCPRCAAQNEDARRFCRQCGLSLATVQLAVEGRTDEAIVRTRKGKDSLTRAGLTLALCMLGALVNILLSPIPWNLYLAIGNLVLGLIVAVPMLISGYLNLSRADRALNPEDQSSRSLQTGQQSSKPAALPPALPTDSLLSGSLAPGSVTEQTTLNLRRPDRES